MAKVRRGGGPGCLQPPQGLCSPVGDVELRAPLLVPPALLLPIAHSPLLSPQLHFPSQRPRLVWKPKPSATTVPTPSSPAGVQPHASISASTMLFTPPPLAFRLRAGGELCFAFPHRALQQPPGLSWTRWLPPVLPRALLGAHSWAICTFPSLLAPLPQPSPSTPAQLPAAPQRLGESLGLIVLQVNELPQCSRVLLSGSCRGTGIGTRAGSSLPRYCAVILACPMPHSLCSPSDVGMGSPSS